MISQTFEKPFHPQARIHQIQQNDLKKPFIID